MCKQRTLLPSLAHCCDVQENKYCHQEDVQMEDSKVSFHFLHSLKSVWVLLCLFVFLVWKWFNPFLSQKSLSPWVSWWLGNYWEGAKVQWQVMLTVILYWIMKKLCALIMLFFFFPLHELVVSGNYTCKCFHAFLLDRKGQSSYQM